jgi:heterodisulfide reductase subunit C
MERKMKYQRESDPEWAQAVGKRLGCEAISACMQCGTCSAACPLSIYMDYTPRRIINLVREGFRTDVLRSQTIWLCASCDSCLAHCPRKINLTYLMYSLKREAIQQGLYPARFPIPVLAREFYKMVRRHGRSTDLWLVLRVALHSSPLILLSMMKTGWDLFRTGRVFLRPAAIQRVQELQRALEGSREAA